MPNSANYRIRRSLFSASFLAAKSTQSNCLSSRLETAGRRASALTNPMIHADQLGEAYPVQSETFMPSTRILRPSARQNTLRTIEPNVLLQRPFMKIEEHHQPQPLEHSLPTVGGFVHTLVRDPQNVMATLVSPEYTFCAAPRLRPPARQVCVMRATCAAI